MKKVGLVVVSLIFALNVYAESPSNEDILSEVNDNVSYEYVECASYFAIVGEGMARSGNTEVSKKYKDTSLQAIQFALMTAESGRSKKMAREVTLSRFDLSMKDMMKLTDNNFSNISLLMSKYTESCLAAMENPEGIFEKWGDKIIFKYAGQ